MVFSRMRWVLLFAAIASGTAFAQGGKKGKGGGPGSGAGSQSQTTLTTSPEPQDQNPIAAGCPDFSRPNETNG